jgi:diaminopimelate epimerase
MAALTADRNTPHRDGTVFHDTVAADAVIFTGALCALDAGGDAVPATSGGNAARGVAHHAADNTGGADGDIRVELRRGVYRFDNGAGGAALARADIGAVAYVVDDQTVGKTGTAVAGVMVDIDDVGVWVDVGRYSITVEA